MAARRKKTGAKVNIPMCLACVLLCLTLFSVHFSSGVVARYTTTTDSGDSARVIKFGDLTLTEPGGRPSTSPPALRWNGTPTSPLRAASRPPMCSWRCPGCMPEPTAR